MLLPRRWLGLPHGSVVEVSGAREGEDAADGEDAGSRGVDFIPRKWDPHDTNADQVLARVEGVRGMSRRRCKQASLLVSSASSSSQSRGRGRRLGKKGTREEGESRWGRRGGREEESRSREEEERGKSGGRSLARVSGSRLLKESG